MAGALVCNYRRCRRAVRGAAWVTSCSHAFCAEHGAEQFRRGAGAGGGPGPDALACPACGAELRDKFDVIQADLEPSEAFKSIVLAGLKPDVVMDVAMRAVSFWSYQMEQETLYQESQAGRARDKLQCADELNALNVQKLKAELENCKRKALALQQEFSRKRKQTEELTATLEERNRRIQKLNFQLESLKRKGIHINNEQEADSNRKGDWTKVEDMVTRRAAQTKFVFRPPSVHRHIPLPQTPQTPKTPMFNFDNRKNHYPNFQFKPV